MTEVFRTVVGVDIVVPGPAQADLRLSGLGLKALPGTDVASLTIHIADRGRKLVKPLLAVSLRGPNNYRRAIDRQLDTILPGDTIAYPFLWPDSLLAGTYHVVVHATGAPHAVSVAATLQLGKALARRDQPDAAQPRLLAALPGRARRRRAGPGPPYHWRRRARPSPSPSPSRRLGRRRDVEIVVDPPAPPTAEMPARRSRTLTPTGRRPADRRRRHGQ